MELKTKVKKRLANLEDMALFIYHKVRCFDKDQTFKFGPDRLRLRCIQCGWESSGWELR